MLRNGLTLKLRVATGIHSFDGRLILSRLLTTSSIVRAQVVDSRVQDRSESDDKDGTSGASIPRFLGTWYTKHASVEHQKSMLEHVSGFRRSSGEQLSVIALVTPGNLHLFEAGAPFHKDLMSRLASSTEALPLHSAVAVVDALPAYITGNGRASEVVASEGISICVGSAISLQRAHPNISEVPSITFTSPDTNNPSGEVSIRSHLANTLFLNGKPQTMFVQSGSSGSGNAGSAGREDLQSISIPLCASTDDRSVMLRTPLLHLTLPGTISASMGNIVSEIEMADGSTKAASFELEQLVPPLLKKLQRERQANDPELKVFALVCPPGVSLRTEPGKRLSVGDELKDHSRLMHTLSSGARLHRVTSGGGGWGKKAGLLSLEPAIDFETDTGVSGAFSHFNFEGDDVTMMGSARLLPPGHTIQFFATFEVESIDSIINPKMNDMSPARSNEDTSHLTTIGTTIPSEEVAGVTSPGTSGKLVYRPGQFGMLSSSPLSLTWSYGKTKHNTLIEMLRTTFSIRVG